MLMGKLRRSRCENKTISSANIKGEKVVSLSFKLLSELYAQSSFQ